MRNFENSPLPRDERDRYIRNPLRLVRCLADLAVRPVVMVDDALYEFGDMVESRPYNEANYPPITNVEAPVATEEELMGNNITKSA